MGRCMHTGCICCYGGVDLDNLALLCKSSSDLLCIRHTCCLDVNTQHRPVGCPLPENERREDEVCKVGLPCCECGIVEPSSLCLGVSQCLCCYNVISLPCNRNYVASCSCAYVFLQCAPAIGCCSEPPVCPALDHLQSEEMDMHVMDRL